MGRHLCVAVGPQQLRPRLPRVGNLLQGITVMREITMRGVTVRDITVRVVV